MSSAIGGQSRSTSEIGNSLFGDVNQTVPCKNSEGSGTSKGAKNERLAAMPLGPDARIENFSSQPGSQPRRHNESDLTCSFTNDQLNRCNEKLACMFTHGSPKQEAINGAKNDADSNTSQGNDNQEEVVAAESKVATCVGAKKLHCRSGASSGSSSLHPSFVFICTLTQLTLVQLAARVKKPIGAALDLLAHLAIWSPLDLHQPHCRCILAGAFFRALMTWCQKEVARNGHHRSDAKGSLPSPFPHQPSSKVCQNDKSVSGFSSMPNRTLAVTANRPRTSRAHLVLFALCVCTLAVPHVTALDNNRQKAILDLEEEEAAIGKNLSPQCQDEKSICGYMQINSVGLNRVSVCACKGRVECPLWWDRYGVQTVRHGNDLYKYCTRKPKLIPCKPDQIAYSSFGQSDLITGRKMADVQRAHCLCPPDHILKTNKTSFEMLDTSYIYGTELLCQKAPRCTRRQICLSITETAEATLEKRHCRCSLGKICPKDVRLAYEKIQEEKGAIFNMRCV